MQKINIFIWIYKNRIGHRIFESSHCRLAYTPVFRKLNTILEINKRSPLHLMISPSQTSWSETKRILIKIYTVQTTCHNQDLISIVLIICSIIKLIELFPSTLFIQFILEPLINFRQKKIYFLSLSFISRRKRTKHFIIWNIRKLFKY